MGHHHLILSTISLLMTVVTRLQINFTKNLHEFYQYYVMINHVTTLLLSIIFIIYLFFCSIFLLLFSKLLYIQNFFENWLKYFWIPLFFYKINNKTGSKLQSSRRWNIFSTLNLFYD